MEIKEFIEKTNDVVKFLVNAVGQGNFIDAARIITKQAEMDCDGLIEECNEFIVMMEKAKIELLALRQQCPQMERLDNPKYDIEEKRNYWRQACNALKEFYDGEPMEYTDKAK